MPEQKGSSPRISPQESGDRVRVLKKSITARFPTAEDTLKRAGLDKILTETQFNRAKIATAANLVRVADSDITGIYNKVGFLKRVHTESPLLRRLNQPATFAFIDLNGLKTINDEQGHEAGDEYIQRAVNTLQAATRASDVIGKYGGDELCALLIGMKISNADVWLQHFKEHMEKAGISASVGFAAFDPDNIEATIAKADEMMYTAKKAYYKERGLELRKT
jgi:diguanylate cyclase (GGDEF)-like protein